MEKSNGLAHRFAFVPNMLGVEVVVGVSPENFTFFSGSYIFTTRTLPPRQAFAIIAQDREPAVLVCSIERAHPEEESWIKSIRTYVEFIDHPMDALAAALEEQGLGRARIGLDLQFLPQASFARLSARLPDATFVDTTEAVAMLRAIKTPDQVAIIEKATKSTHDATMLAMREAQLGETEKSMANRLLTHMIEMGADGTTFLVFGSGRRSGMTHALPTDRRPSESEIIRLDFGGWYGPWQSDFARTYSTGNPTSLQRDTYRALAAVQRATIGSIRPGIAAEDVFFTCRSEFEKEGIRFVMPHVGHGFGLELHEFPMLRPGNKAILQPGMVLNVEPITIDADRSGYQLEDLVLVTDDGHRILTQGLPPPEIPAIGATS